MARDFLSGLESFRRRCRTGGETLKRRAEVVTHLSEKYKIRRGQADEVLEAVRSAGFDISRSLLAADTAIFRNAFRYLEGETELADRAEEQSGAELIGIQALLGADISSWEELEQALQPEEPEERPEPEEAEEAVSGRDEALGLVETLQKVLLRLYDRNETLEQENAELRARIEELQEEHGRVTEDLEAMLDLARELEAREPGARKKPEPAPAKPEERDEEEEPNGSLPLPDYSEGYDLPLQYMGSFLKEYRRRTQGEQAQVVKALEGLHPFEASDTKPVYPTASIPNRSVQTKAGRKWRIIWQKMDGVIRVHHLLKRGDSRLKYSER